MAEGTAKTCLLLSRVLGFNLFRVGRLAIRHTFPARPCSPGSRLGIEEVLTGGQLLRDAFPPSVIVQIQTCPTAPVQSVPQSASTENILLLLALHTREVKHTPSLFKTTSLAVSVIL